MEKMFRLRKPAATDIAAFHRDGYIAYPDILTDAARAGLIDEAIRPEPVQAFLNKPETAEPATYFVRPWNDRGPWSDRLIDDPFITALLHATIGPDYHFCHSAMNIARRGAEPVVFHQDHHHWKHEPYTDTCWLAHNNP